MIKYVNLVNYNKEQTAYRYLTIEKFIHMICTETFVFPRITLFDDIFEATYPIKYIERHRDHHEYILKLVGVDSSKFEPPKSAYENAIHWREHYFISCWHANDYESEAMWRLYSNDGKGIAIVSSIQNLIDSFPEYYDNEGFENPLFLAEVKYLDFHKEGEELFIPHTPIDPCILKRKSFEYEKEIRIYTHIKSGWGNKEIGIEPPIKGNIISFPVDYNKLINKIIVAPNSPSWYFEVITAICEKFSINVPIEESETVGEPIIRSRGLEWL